MTYNFNLRKLKKKINFREYLIKNTGLSLSKITRISYDLQSGSYTKIYNRLHKDKNKHMHLDNMKNLSKYLKNKDLKTILDFGTGEGNKLPYILRSNKEIKKIFACDVSFNRLCVGHDFLKKELNQKELSKVILFCNEDFELPFKNSSLDVVYTSGVLENMSTKKMNEMILELLRVTKKRLILIEPRKKNITKTDLLRMKKFKLNFNVNNVLKKNKIKFKEDKWHSIRSVQTPYSIRIIDKKTKSFNESNFYIKNENYPFFKKNNFLYNKLGKIIPLLNHIAIFRPLSDLYFFK
mgnify:CR=1 FL=1